MTDKEKLDAIKAEIESKYAFFGNSSDIAWGKKVAYGQMLNYINSLPEEPVSEELEEAVNDYIGFAPEVDECLFVYSERKSFRAGAKWKKEQMMKDATEVTVHIDTGGYPYIPQMELYDYDKDVPLAKEGDKYKVILIKEE